MAKGKNTQKDQEQTNSVVKSKVIICEEQKVKIITYLLENSKVLYGELSMALSKLDQRQGWEDCFEYCVSIKAHYRDVKHLMDVINGWKRALRLKFSRCQQTGAGVQPATTESEEQLYNLIIGSKKLTRAFKVKIK
jgi:hypothetical protein